MEKKDVVVAIDIGTTKILAIVAEVFPGEKDFRIIGYGRSDSRGLNKGVVVDVAEASMSMESALHAAEDMADMGIEKAFIGVAGKHIESNIARVSLELGKTPREITEQDRQKLEETGEKKAVALEKKAIHKIAYNYKIDGGNVVKNPVGMTGMKIEADVHVVSGAVNQIEALCKCVNNLNIEVEDVVVEPLASAKAVLSDTEKKLGTVIVDIGGGTTDIAIFKNEKMIYTQVIPVGGEHFTTDIATVLNIDLRTADRLKKEFSAFGGDFEPDEIIEIPSYVGKEPKKVELGYLDDIVQCRIDDILEHIGKKLEASGYKHLVPNGIVFTGGASKISGLKEKAEKYFDIPVRMGVPIQRKGILDNMIKPEDATAVGLLLFGIEKYFAGKINPIKRTESDASFINSLKEKMKSWFDNLF